MPESYIGLPADSSGKKTRTNVTTYAGQSVHEEYVRMAAAPTYYSWTSPVTVGAGSKHMWTVMNQSGSNRTVKVRKIFFQNMQTASVAIIPATFLGLQFDLSFTSAASLGAGTMVPIIAVDSGDLIQTVPSTALVYTAHNASVTMINSRLFSWPILPVTVASNVQYAMQLAQTNVLAEGNEVKEITLRENMGLTVLCANSWALGQFGVYSVVTIEVNS